MKPERIELTLTLVCGVCLGAGLALEAWWPQEVWGARAVWALAYVTGGFFGVRAGWASLRQGVVDVDLLMVLAALGAAGVGNPFEGGMLLFLFALSNVLQDHALDRSRKAIQALMKLRPAKVLARIDGGNWVPTRVEEVPPGALVRVKPGESIALDGVVEKGESSVDESALTGEAMPVEKGRGSPLFAGAMNQGGALEYRVSKAAADSTLARIITLVEEAQAEKARTQHFLERAEQVYAMGVILLTIGLILVPWLLMGQEFKAVFYRAMTVMVVASPCALVISTPAAFLSAIGGAARRGVLFKGGLHLERLAEVDVVAFDKTGTLTLGKPRVIGVATVEGGGSEEEVLRDAAALELHSEHPLARAVIDAARERGLEVPEPDGFQSIAGKGAVARIGGRRLAVGSLPWFEENGTLPWSGRLRSALEGWQAAGTGVIVLGEMDDAGRVTHLLGAIGIADALRPEVVGVVRELHRIGVRRVAMLTGDHERVARHIAEKAGIDEVYAELLPGDKLETIRKLSDTGKVVMVGDGVNDAPALAAAYVGVAMGAAGTDVAMETADVVLMGENLGQLLYALRIARKSRQIVLQNLVFAMGVIVVLAASALSVGIPLPLGVVGHEGSTVLVCLNGLRLLAYRPNVLPGRA